MHVIQVISLIRSCQYGEAIAFIHFCSWWSYEIRLSNGVCGHRSSLGPGGLWSGLHFSRYVYRIGGKNVDTGCAIWNTRCRFRF